MPVATISRAPPMTTPGVQQTARAPLRRATYIHISDLTSAYNIDHRKLEQELARVKSKDDSVAPLSDEGAVDLSPMVGGGDGDHASIASGGPPQQKRLQPPRGGYNLCVLVGEVNTVVDKLRVDRSRVRLAEVVVGDETGCVSLRARDDQIDVLKEVSERSGAVVLRNSTLELFQGKHIRLAVTKWGKLIPYPDQVASTPPPPSKMNKDRNFSLIDLSLVASEMVDDESALAERDVGTESRGSSGRGGPRHHHLQHQPYNQQYRKPGPNRRQQRHYQPTYGHQPRHMGHAPYQGVPYPYGQPPQHRPQEGRGMHQAPTQHLLLQQHYEFQQRQMQQMQAYHEQQERRQGQQMQPSMMPPNIAPTTSFDTTGDYSVGASPMFVPVSMAGSRSSASPMLSPGPNYQEHYGGTGTMTPPSASYGPGDTVTGSEGTVMQRPQGDMHGASLQGGLMYPPGAMSSSQGDSEGRFVSEESDRSPTDAWASQLSPSGPHFLSSRSESPMSLSPGQMNPGARAFDPSYLKHPGQQQGYGYVAYDPSQRPIYASQQPAPYSQNVMYHAPVAEGAELPQDKPQSRDSATPQTHQGSQDTKGGSAHPSDENG